MKFWGADHRRRILVSATLSAVLATIFLWPGTGSPAGAKESCEKEPSGSSQTFEYTGKKATFKVPAKFKEITVIAMGGHGGQDDHTAAGGRGALVETVVPVKPGECLTVYVGGYGHYGGGWGWAKGGDHGTAAGESAGHSAGGGGGASAVLRGSTPLVVAGGGGGGGGDASEHPNWGGKGGDAGKPGQKGDGPAGGEGGEGGGYYDSEIPSGHNSGLAGENVGASDIGAGAGGGGGGGISPNEPGYGGGGGGGGDHGKGPDINPAHLLHERETASGGGGGGGGGSLVGPNAKGTKYSVSPRSCPAGHSPKTCAGQVVIEWGTGPDHVAAIGGSGQSATIESSFSRPLVARVTN